MLSLAEWVSSIPRSLPARIQVHAKGQSNGNTKANPLPHSSRCCPHSSTDGHSQSYAETYISPLPPSAHLLLQPDER